MLCVSCVVSLSGEHVFVDGSVGMTTWVLVGAGLLVLVALVYWQLVPTEGTYLGTRVVTLLYDLSARRYDRMKQYDLPLEDATLGRPLAKRVRSDPQALVLDVATGTGRVPMSLLRQTKFQGKVIGLDISGRMLEQAAGNLTAHNERVCLLRHDAGRLPFEDSVFGMVTCVEALEFLPHPMATLREMVRVLRPGGTLLFTNRIGPEALFLPGKVFPRHRVEEMLAAFPLRDVSVSRWEVNYDQILAYRTGEQLEGAAPHRLHVTLPCPICGVKRLQLNDSNVSCEGCGHTLSSSNGVVDLTQIHASEGWT